MCEPPPIPADTVTSHAASFCLPDELCVSPHVHVALSGLDRAAGAGTVHRRVIDALLACRGATAARSGTQGGASAGGSAPVSSASVHYSFLDVDHKFPASKPPRTSYDWLQPRGILKRGWIRKHLYQVPAVVVVMFDLEWMDGEWSSRMQLCASRLQTVRASLGSHVTRLALVLLQQCDPLTPSSASGSASGGANSELLATHRLAELCAACDLNTKSLLVLPVNQHLAKHAARLENVLLELAFTYYQHRVKMAHGSRDLLSAVHHQKLFVRQQFKIGFFSEIKQDWAVAHKAYDQSFTHLLELPVDDWQVLCVAALISYKICRLAFARNLPRDAVAHFRRHVDLLVSGAGVYNSFAETSVVCHHFDASDSPLCRAWLSQQHIWFADLFARAVQHGLSALPQQNPGVYYQLAALHARHRRLQAQILGSKLAEIEYPIPDPLSQLGHGEFIGEYGYPAPFQYKSEYFTVPASSSTAHASAVPQSSSDIASVTSVTQPYPSTASDCSQLAVNLLESRAVPHATLVIPLLSAAVSHHKRQRCERRAARLTTLMAHEYAASGEHDKAVVLLQKVLPIYWSECWWPLITQLTTDALYSCFMDAGVAPYLLMASVLLSQPVPDDNDRTFAQMFQELDTNFNRILLRTCPLPLSAHAVPESDLSSVSDRWTSRLSAWPADTPLQVDMGRPRAKNSLMVSASATFAADRVQLVSESSESSTLPVLVHVTSCSAHTISVLAVSVTVERVSGGGYRSPVAPAVGPDSTGIVPVLECRCTAGEGDYTGRRSIIDLSPLSSAHTISLTLTPPSAADSALILSSWHVTVTSAADDVRADGASDGESIAVCFSWKHTPSLAVDLQNSSPRILSSSAQHLAHTPDIFSAVVLPPVARVKLHVHHTPPALLGELYLLHVRIEGCGPASPTGMPAHLLAQLLRAASLDVGPAYVLQTADNSQAVWTASEKVMLVREETTHTLSSPVTLPCPDVTDAQTSQVPVVVQCLDMTPPTLQMSLRYVECGHQFTVTDNVQIPVVQPFQAQLRVLNERFEVVDSVRVADTLFLYCEITSTSPHHLTIHHTTLATSGTQFESLDEEPSDPTVSAANENTSTEAVPVGDECVGSLTCHQASPLLTECFLAAGQSVAECRTLRVRAAGGGSSSEFDHQESPSASLTVYWSRCEERSVSTHSSSIPPAISRTVLSLPTIPLSPGSPPFSLSLCLPAVARVGVPVLVRYQLKAAPAGAGCWMHVQLDSCEAFMTHGVVKSRVNLAPGQQRELLYTLFPLTAGSSLLPRLRISLDQPVSSVSSSSSQPLTEDRQLKTLTAAVESAIAKLPSHLYVLPEVKSEGMASDTSAESWDKHLSLMCV